MRFALSSFSLATPPPSIRERGIEIPFPPSPSPYFREAGLTSAHFPFFFPGRIPPFFPSFFFRDLRRRRERWRVELSLFFFSEILFHQVKPRTSRDGGFPSSFFSRALVGSRGVLLPSFFFPLRSCRRGPPRRSPQKRSFHNALSPFFFFLAVWQHAKIKTAFFSLFLPPTRLSFFYPFGEITIRSPLLPPPSERALGAQELSNISIL